METIVKVRKWQNYRYHHKITAHLLYPFNFKIYTQRDIHTHRDSIFIQLLFIQSVVFVLKFNCFFTTHLPSNRFAFELNFASFDLLLLSQVQLIWMKIMIIKRDSGRKRDNHEPRWIEIEKTCLQKKWEMKSKSVE